jgi:hypothetical protein
MGSGTIVAEGTPVEIVDEALVAKVFALECQVIPDPLTGTPLIVPVPARSGRTRVDVTAGVVTGTVPVWPPPRSSFARPPSPSPHRRAR